MIHTYGMLFYTSASLIYAARLHMYPRCGQSLARLGAEVVGVDPSPENVAVASAHARGDPLTRAIRYEAATAEELEARGVQTTYSISRTAVVHNKQHTAHFFVLPLNS